MARLQILELPSGLNDERPPFILVIDEYLPRRYIVGFGQESEVVDEFEKTASLIGARAVLTFPETVTIPANEPLPVTADADSAGTTEIVYAHERTRLDLCSALLVSGDTTWRKLIETVSERQRELAGLLRERYEPDPKLVALARKTLGIELTPDGIPLAEALHNACRQLEKSEAARAHLREERDEGRLWARHGYEIGQRHCGWTDHGVAPAWLTEGWPYSFDSCEHLKQAADLDEAVTRVRAVSTEPEVMDSQQEHPGVWKHGYHCGVRAAQAALRPRDEPTVKP